MNLFSPWENLENYANAGKKKTERSIGRLFILAVLAGLVIAFGGATAATATHAIGNVSLQRLISGLLFPFGLGIVILTGLELFTGNCLIAVSVLEKKTTVKKMLYNWIVVYLGNFVGALLLAAGCAFFGQLDASGGLLAVHTIKVAAAKCAISFPNGVVLGIFCNVLVCLGALLSLTAKDVAGRVMGAYLPVALFVICGFEHCVANMFYVPAGLFAVSVPQYAQLAAEAGIDVSMLTWGNFLLRNLVPVTIGNILGGAGVGAALWYGHKNN